MGVRLRTFQVIGIINGINITNVIEAENRHKAIRYALEQVNLGHMIEDKSHKSYGYKIHVQEINPPKVYRVFTFYYVFPNEI